jgi:hypothetical protein
MVDLYKRAVADLRLLLAQLGRREFRAYGYSAQLRRYRATLQCARKVG